LIGSALIALIALVIFDPRNRVAADDPVPKLVDTSGKTKFHCLFVSGDDEFDGDTSEIQDLWNAWPKAPGSSSRLIKTPLIRSVLTTYLDELKKTWVSGNEVCIYYAGHGGDGATYGATDYNGDDPDGRDNHITSTRQFGETITDDQLAQMISGFAESVTIVVMLDSCWGGTFSDGSADLPSATNKDGAKYGAHLSHIGPPGTIRNEMTEAMKSALENSAGKPTADSSGDGILTAEELRGYLQSQGALSTSGEGSKCTAPSSASVGGIAGLIDDDDAGEPEATGSDSGQPGVPVATAAAAAVGAALVLAATGYVRLRRPRRA
jgi:hypothetical protein